MKYHQEFFYSLEFLQYITKNYLFLNIKSYGENEFV